MKERNLGKTILVTAVVFLIPATGCDFCRADQAQAARVLQADQLLLRRLAIVKRATVEQEQAKTKAPAKEAEEKDNTRAADDKPALNDFGKIQPPGGVPLLPGRARVKITAHAMNKVRKRLDAAPSQALDKWVVELERIMDQKLEGELAKQACRTYFVTRMSVAFDDLKWNAKASDNLFKRAETMPASEVRVWKKTFEALLKKRIGQTDKEIYDGGPADAIPLVLIPVDTLYEGQQYSAERGKKYLARMKQLTAEDVSLWRDKVDEYGGTELDAAVNIILRDEYFDKEKFQRDKFKAAIGARKK
jgi:hypothetical protein